MDMSSCSLCGNVDFGFSSFLPLAKNLPVGGLTGDKILPLGVNVYVHNACFWRNNVFAHDPKHTCTTSMAEAESWLGTAWLLLEHVQ